MSVQASERDNKANEVMLAFLRSVLGGTAVAAEVVRGWKAPVKLPLTLTLTLSLTLSLTLTLTRCADGKRRSRRSGSAALIRRTSRTTDCSRRIGQSSSGRHAVGYARLLEKIQINK